MGLFKRVGALIRGFFSNITGNIENKNPELLLEDTKNKIEKSRKTAEKCLIDIQTNAELERMEVRAIEKSLENIRFQINAAKEHNERDLLIELLIKEEEETNLLEVKKESHAEAVKEALKIRDDYKIFESEMSARISEIRALKSRARIADIKRSIVELDEKFSKDLSQGLHSSDINDNMNKAREIVNAKDARAQATQNLREDSTGYKLKHLDASILRERAAKRADELLATAEQ